MIDFLKYKEVISFIWGFALAVIFRRVCDNGNCVIVKRPSDDSIESIHTFNNSCYTFKPYAVSC